MADRTVRAIFEARVTGARKGMTDLSKDVADAGKKVDVLTKDLKTLDATKVKPTIDVKIDDAKKRLADLTRELADLKAQPSSLKVDFQIEQAKAAIKDVRKEIKDLTGEKAEVRIAASIDGAEKQIKAITVQLGELRTMEVTPQVTADIKKAEKDLAEARKTLRQLNGAKAEMQVTADTSPAKREVKGLADDIGDAGQDAGDEAGEGIASGILSALQTIPIAGAVVGVGLAIGVGILAGIQDGLQVEAERDIFSAQTGLDEFTSARFGRAAGEAYANAWGDSVAANLDTAKRAMQAGIINSDATDAEIESVIAKLQGLNDLFEYDIAMSVQGVGNLMKTGLAKDADQAFDLIVAASQKLPSDDLIETLNEYSNQFVTLGLTAEQSFGLIVQGAEAGARDTDIVADALKEMGLRIREGTDPAIDALDSLGLKSKDIVKAFQEGGPNATKAMDKVFDALAALEAKGGNTQAVIAALFGGPGEDLGSALFALNVDTAAAAVGGLEGAAGAADRALSTMSDNAAAKVESAKRNIQLAADGIKGALASAFEDDIADASDWVSKNRAPLMEFFLDVINGTLDMGVAFAGFAASSLESIAALAEGFADLAEAIDIIPGIDTSGAAESLRGLADGAREGAETIRTEVPAALEEVRDKANSWAAPEILKARVHDATMAMADDMDIFSAKVDESGGTVTINGDKVNAEQALATLTANINAEDGTVTINGDRVPAEQALDTLMRLIGNSKESVSVGADTAKANASRLRLLSLVANSVGSIGVNANTAAAARAIDFAARDRSSTIRVGYLFTGTRQSQGLGGAHEGGFLPGRHAGGRVPGVDPGYDNVLWPLNSGGRTLQQPLAGGEYVVNSKDAAFWAPVLELMNAGARPQAAATAAPSTTARVHPRDVQALGAIIAQALGSKERTEALNAAMSRKAGQ